MTGQILAVNKEGTTMTTSTMTATDLTVPTFTITVGEEYDVRPDEGPLLFWRTAYSALAQHNNYSGTFRPTRVRVVRVERGGGTATCNVLVNFRDDRGTERETWVHHSFLIDPNAPVIDAEAAQVAAVSAFMVTDIGGADWPGAGAVRHWLESDRDTWFAAGNKAVLDRRANIESGSVNAGAVWCEAASAARRFAYDHRTEEFLHQWFVTHRDYLTTLMVNAETEAGQNLAGGDQVIVVDGVEYVRKDVIDRDIATFTEITHAKSVEHSLCGVYDETQRMVDDATTYIKMGARYKDYDVSVEQTIVVRRTFRVERSLDQAAAIEQARRIARDYALTTVNACRTGETVNIISVGDTRDTAARARAVN
jgi:hypothetical protein